MTQREAISSILTAAVSPKRSARPVQSVSGGASGDSA
jgi:hypothetical protein